VATALWRDPWLAIAVVAGPLVAGALGWQWGPALGAGHWTRPLPVLMAISVYPLLEELCFRGLLQGWLLERLPRRQAMGPSAANVLSSMAFAAAHLPSQAAAWAAATLLPSLLLGHLRERHDSLLLPITLHAYFNAGLIVAALHGR